MEGERFVVEGVYGEVFAVPKVAPFVVILFLLDYDTKRNWDTGCAYCAHVHPQGVAIAAAALQCEMIGVHGGRLT